MDKLLTNSPSKEYFEAIYPTAVKKFCTLKGRLGLSCPNALFYLKYIWLAEVEKDKDKFFKSIETGQW